MYYLKKSLYYFEKTNLETKCPERYNQYEKYKNYEH